MRTHVRVRRHWSPTQREELLRRYRKSELTQKEFVAQSGLGLSTLTGWLRKAKKRETSRTAFVAVPNLLAVPVSPATYRLQLPRGVSLEVRTGFDPEELAVWLERLQVL